ncbi:hypothetical protein Tco_1077637, partial [Tanacetum coccineum]
MIPTQQSSYYLAIWVDSELGTPPRKIVKLWFAIAAHHEVDTILTKLHLPFHKEDGKRLRKELELLRRVVRSDALVFQMLTQLESQPEIGG